MAVTTPPVPASRSADAGPAYLTADEFLRHPAAEGASELVNGEVVYVSPAGGRHNVVAGNLYLALAPHVRARGLGHTFTDNQGYVLPVPGRVRETVRSPDVSFVSVARLPEVPVGFIRLAPDLAVEVLSPDDTAADVDERMADYFAAGTALLWVVDPARRTAAVHARAAGTRWLDATGVLDGADVVPGFTLPVAALFEGLAPFPATPRAR